MREVAIRTLRYDERVKLPPSTIKKLGWLPGDSIKVYEDLENKQIVIKKSE